MGNTFTQAIRCIQCAYVDCRCLKPAARPEIVIRNHSAGPIVARIPITTPPKPSPAPSNDLEALRARMRRGETIPLTGPGSLSEALAKTNAPTPAPTVKPAPKPAAAAPDIKTVRELLDRETKGGARMGQMMLDGILEETVSRAI